MDIIEPSIELIVSQICIFTIYLLNASGKGNHESNTPRELKYLMLQSMGYG